MMTSPQTPTSAIEDKGAVPQTPTSATTDAKETIILPSAPNQDITPPDATPKSLEVQPFTDETPQEFVHRIKKNYGIREDELDDKEKRKAKYLFLTKKGEEAIKAYFNASIESKSALGVIRFDFAKMQKEDVAFIKQNGLTPYDFTAEGAKALTIKTKGVKNASPSIENIKKWIRTTY